MHLGCHGCLAPFLAGARDGGFVFEKYFELAADCGCIVVAWMHSLLALQSWEIDSESEMVSWELQ